METKHGTLYLVTFASSRGKNVTSEKKVTAFEMCIYTVFLYVNGFFFHMWKQNMANFVLSM